MNKFRIDLLNDDRIYNYTLVNLITPAMSEVFEWINLKGIIG